jgi:triacylglycerol lipase
MPVPILPGYDNDLALSLAAACQLAYQMMADPNAAAPDGYQVQARFTADLFGQMEVIGYVMSSAANVVLAFRGTDSTPDFISDISYAEVDFPFVPASGQVHEGFLGVYQSCRAQILPALQALPAQLPLFITGHSLGGAMATLAAFDIAVNTPFTAPVVYTFASPRVGDPAFADAYNARVAANPANSWRVANSFDVVPLLPPEEIYDALELQYFYYEHVTDVVRIGFLKGGIVGNHALANYIAALQGG